MRWDVLIFVVHRTTSTFFWIRNSRGLFANDCRKIKTHKELMAHFEMCWRVVEAILLNWLFQLGFSVCGKAGAHFALPYVRAAICTKMYMSVCVWWRFIAEGVFSHVLFCRYFRFTLTQNAHKTWRNTKPWPIHYTTQENGHNFPINSFQHPLQPLCVRTVCACLSSNSLFRVFACGPSVYSELQKKREAPSIHCASLLSRSLNVCEIAKTRI